MTIGEAVRPKTEHLEALFKRYPDVPEEVIVKEDLLREGFQFTQAAVDFGGEGVRKTYHLFSWDQSKIDDMADRKAPVKLPNLIDVSGGPFGLRRMRMRPRIRMGSPYTVDVVDGKLLVLNQGEQIGEIGPYPPEPAYFQKRFPDGTPYYEVVPPDGYVIVFRQCQHWGPDEECKFCDINENARTKKLLGQVASIAPKDPQQVATVMEEIFLHEDWLPAYRPRHVHINGGSITKSLRGQSEVAFYLKYVTAIKERIGNRWPIELQTQPWPKGEERHAYEMGVNVRDSNFEVWDKGLFQIICPGKDRVIGRDEWLRRVIDQADVYGEGRVVPGFVAGVEMAQPWGFKTVAEAVASTTEGMEFLMSHGVVPRPISWCVEALSFLAGQEEPPIDYFIQIDRNWYELWRKYRLPPPGPSSYSLLGPGRNEYPNNAAFDMGPL